MKTKLIFAGVIAFTSLSYAQNTAWPAPGATSNVGIGTSSPSSKVQVVTATGNDGMEITQIGSLGCRLLLNNTTTGGKKWGLYSLGSGNNQGSGNFLIHDQTSGTNRLLISGANGYVGIGTITPNAQLHAVGTTVGIEGDATNTSGIGVIGSGGALGVRGDCFGSGNVGFRAGVRGNANGGAYNYGGYFASSGSSSGVVTFGVYSEIFNTNLGSTNYGIFSTVGGNSTSGIGPNYAGYFDGDVFTTSASYYTSDRTLKKDITKISNSLELINLLNPVTYNFDVKSNPSIALPSEKQYGFISQEVQKIFPEFTKTIIHPAKLDEKGNEISPKREILGLNYMGFIALLTKGIQDQEIRIDELEKQLAEVLSQKSNQVTGINSDNIVETGFQMSQNVPNPFTHETVVNYTIPASVSNAYMAVYDLTGKQITTFPINQKGSSSVTITSEKLAAGIYIYSIVADGKVVDSKRMIVAEK